MGYIQLLADCFVCRRPFTSNPHRVPSFQGQPICLDCITRVREKQKEKGLPLWPLYADSYEPAEEGF